MLSRNNAHAAIAVAIAVSFGSSLVLSAPAFAGHRGDRAARRTESQQPSPPAQVGPSGETVHDDIFKVTWLTDANLAAKETFQVPNINHSGSMDYQTAIAWVKAMNARNYRGHNNWTLPTSPKVDKGCNSRKDNNFGYNCTLSGLGSLYANSLHYSWPRSVVGISGNRVGPFKNFQPNIYWTAEAAGKNKNGFDTFSFNNGFQGSNVDQNYFYALPMVAGPRPCPPAAAGGGLQLSSDGKTVYDPVSCVTWPADANLAASEKFGLALKDSNGVATFSPTGGMTHTSALSWVQQMNVHGYGGHEKWALPPIAKAHCGSASPVAGCAGNPLGELYYNQLHLSEGQLVTPVPDVKVGAFHNFQPYLYWSCNGDAGQNICSTTKPLPEPNYGWSFNFGDGFQGTDLQTKTLYVMVYYPDAQTPIHPAPIPRCPPGARCPKPM